jgi:hypothetical protein
MHDELDVGLNRPSGLDLILINGCDETFEAARGPGGRRQSLKVEIKCSRPRRDVSIGGGNTKFVLWPPVRKTDEFNAGVCVIVDKVAKTPMPRSSSPPTRYSFCSATA